MQLMNQGRVNRRHRKSQRVFYDGNAKELDYLLALFKRRMLVFLKTTLTRQL